MSLSWSVDNIREPVYRNKFVNAPDIIADWVKEHGGVVGRDLLDFGCGEGTMAVGMALRHGARRVVGVDTHGEMDNVEPYARAQLGVESLPDNLEMIRVDPDSSLEPLGRFDIIYSWSVFEHVSQELIVDCFVNLKRVLRPSGIMFLQTTPLYYSAQGSHLTSVIPEPWAHLSMQQSLLYALLRKNAKNAEQADHLQWVYETLNRTTAPQLLRSAEQAGFAIVREYRTHDEVPVPEELKEIYTMEALTTNQLVFLAKHA